MELKEQLVEAYKKADNDHKQWLETTFGKQVFIHNIMQRVKSYEDACEVEGTDPKSHLPYDESNPNLTNEQKATNATCKLKVIIRVMNEGVPVDYTNSSQDKYQPIFEYKGAAGWVYISYDVWSADTCVGSRLVYLDLKKMQYCVKQFADLYNLHLTY